MREYRERGRGGGEERGRGRDVGRERKEEEVCGGRGKWRGMKRRKGDGITSTHA